MKYSTRKYLKGKKKGAKRYGRKTYNWARTGSTAIKAATALALAYRLKDANNIEYKEINNAQQFAPDINGVIHNLAVIPPGSAQAQRVGDSVKLQNLTFRFFVVGNSPTAQDLVRVIIYRDKQNVISTPSQLLAVVGNAYGVLSPKNEDNKYNTKVLYDRIHASTPSHIAPHKSLVIPLNWHQHYAIGSSTLTDGGLRVCFIALGAAGAGVSDAYFYSSVSYTDN